MTRYLDRGTDFPLTHIIHTGSMIHPASYPKENKGSFPWAQWWDTWYDIFNCNWVATQWQLYSIHINTYNTENGTKQTLHRTTQKYIEQHKKYIEQHKNLEECGPCPVFAGFILAFALQLRKKHRKTSVRVAIHRHTIRIHSHNNKKIHKLHY